MRTKDWDSGPPRKVKRNEAMLLMRQQGARYREIGEAFGVSKQRALHIVKREMAQRAEAQRREAGAVLP